MIAGSVMNNVCQLFRTAMHYFTIFSSDLKNNAKVVVKAGPQYKFLYCKVLSHMY